MSRNSLVINSSNSQLDRSPSARALLECRGDLSQLRTNNILPADTWIEMQRDHVIPMAQQELAAYADLVDAGFTHRLAGIGKRKIEWQIEGETREANVAMQARAMGDMDLIDYEMDVAPVPLIFGDFEIDWRDINAAQIENVPIDLANADATAKKVAIASENLVVNGNLHGLGIPLYGYTSHPDRIIVTGSETQEFNIENAESMVLKLVRAMEINQYRGPFNLYIPPGYSTELYKRFSDGTSDVLNDWLTRVDLIKKVTVTSALAPGNMVLVQMERTVVDLAIGFDLETIEWDVMGGMNYLFRVLTAFTPRIKKRRAIGGGYQTGVAHMRFQPT